MIRVINSLSAFWQNEIPAHARSVFWFGIAFYVTCDVIAKTTHILHGSL